MDIDLAVLRGVERERDISLDVKLLLDTLHRSGCGLLEHYKIPLHLSICFSKDVDEKRYRVFSSRRSSRTFRNHEVNALTASILPA